MVQPQYPGSPSARIVWSFAGKSSDITKFHVVTQVDGVKETHQDVSSSKVQCINEVIDVDQIFKFCREKRNCCEGDSSLGDSPYICDCCL